MKIIEKKINEGATNSDIYRAVKKNGGKHIL